MRAHTLTMMMLVAAPAWSSATAEALVYNVKLPPYNAVGDGTNDDTQEVQAAINAASAAGGGEVYFPAGTYKLSLSIGGGTVSSLTFRGDGQRASTLLFKGLPNNADGIVYYPPVMPDGKYHALTVRGLSVVRYDGFGGTAIWAGWPSPTPGRASYLQGNGSTALLEDFHIGSQTDDNPTASWGAGVSLLNGIGAKVSGFVITGVGDTTQAGIEVWSNDVAIHDGTISGFSRGVRALNNAEGLSLQNVIIRNAFIGVHLSNAKNGNAITNCHILAKSRGVHIYNSQGEMAITGNKIQRLGTADYFIGVELNSDTTTAARHIRVLNNTITGSPTGEIGIIVYNNIVDSVIQGNITQNMAYGIWVFNQAVTNTIVMGNINRSTTYAIFNAGTDTHCVYNAPGIPGNPYQCQ
jgi:hypothetical protein